MKHSKQIENKSRKDKKIEELRENMDCCCRNCYHLKSNHLHKIGNMGSSECWISGCKCKDFNL